MLTADELAKMRGRVSGIGPLAWPGDDLRRCLDEIQRLNACVQEAEADTYAITEGAQEWEYEAKEAKRQRDDLAALVMRACYFTGLDEDPRIVAWRAKAFDYLERERLLGNITRCGGGNAKR